MRKVYAVLVFILVMMGSTTLEAGEYLSYQTLRFQQSHHKLLHQYTTYDYNRMNQHLSGRRFWGWVTHQEVNHARVFFQKETMMVIVNDGLTAIHQNFYFKQTAQERIQFNTAGSIRMNTKGKVKGFDLGLDTTLNVSYSTDTTHFSEERTDLRIEVDPMTRLRVEVLGEGFVSNGVGRYYRFWRQVHEGGWEVFTVSTEYYSIIKERL